MHQEPQAATCIETRVFAARLARRGCGRLYSSMSLMACGASIATAMITKPVVSQTGNEASRNMRRNASSATVAATTTRRTSPPRRLGLSCRFFHSRAAWSSSFEITPASRRRTRWSQKFDSMAWPSLIRRTAGHVDQVLALEGKEASSRWAPMVRNPAILWPACGGNLPKRRTEWPCAAIVREPMRAGDRFPTRVNHRDPCLALAVVTDRGQRFRSGSLAGSAGRRWHCASYPCFWHNLGGPAARCRRCCAELLPWRDAVFEAYLRRCLFYRGGGRASAREFLSLFRLLPENCSQSVVYQRHRGGLRGG